MGFITNGGGGGGGAISGVTVTGTAANGQVPVATSSTAGAWSYPPGFEIGYTQITSNANITDTSESTATALISPGALTFDGGAVMCEFWCFNVGPPTGAAADAVIVTLFEGSTQITRLGIVRAVVTANPNETTVFGRFRFTPTAGSHTYKVCAFCSDTTGTPALNAGAGGTGVNPPAWVRFVKV